MAWSGVPCPVARDPGWFSWGAGGLSRWRQDRSAAGSDPGPMQGQMHQDQTGEQQGQDEMDVAPVVPRSSRSTKLIRSTMKFTVVRLMERSQKHGCSDGQILKRTPIFPPGGTAVKGSDRTDLPGLTNRCIPSRLVFEGPVRRGPGFHPAPGLSLTILLG